MKRLTQWRGYLLVADFDLSPPAALKPYEAEIEAKLKPMEERLAAGEFDKIEIGVFREPIEVRVWGVHHG